MGKSSFGSAVLLINAILVIAGLSACGSDSSLPDTNRASPVFFVANDGTHGMELWKTDGTASGTSMVRDIFPGAGSSTFEGLEQYEMGGFTYFMATEPIHGTELWKTDGTTDGTTLVRDINPAPGIGSLVVHLPGVVSNGRLYFRAEDQTDNLELWATDGTETGTVLIKDIRPPTSESIWHLSEFAALGDLVLFGALNISSGSGLWVSELWVSDGSTSGTRKITDVLPAIGGSYSSRIGQLAGRLYFWANDTSDNFGFWASDGTEAGTQLVKAGVLPSAGTSGPQSMVVVHNWLLFSAQDSSGSGQELWRSDGSEIGTVLVKDINPGWADSSPDYLTVMNGVAYFVANDGTHGYELWRSDGTAPGTYMVKDVRPGALPGYQESPRKLTVSGNTLFFVADDGIHGAELWKSDGTEAGTVMVRDIIDTPGVGSNPWILRASSGVIYFKANDGVHGFELWRSDGTAIGTYLVRDICAGPCDGLQY